MILALRFAATIAALVTITLNASYGFKASTTLDYAVLFALLNAALDIAKCACLPCARLAWQTGERTAALLLLALFLPLLMNSLWCGFAEVAFNRAAVQSTLTVAATTHDRATAEHRRLTRDLETLTANPLFEASAACAIPRTDRQRSLCSRHRDLMQARDRLTPDLSLAPPADPTPHLTLLAGWTGAPLPLLLIGTAFWPIALAELCGSLGFYLSARPQPDRTKRRHKRFWSLSEAEQPPPPQTAPQPLSSANGTPPLRWPTVTTA